MLWDRAIQLTQIEAALGRLKSELGIRPIYHHLEQRVEGHTLVAFLTYCLMVTLKNPLENYAPGLTARVVLDKLATIQILDVWLPPTDRTWLLTPLHTQPGPDQALSFHQLNLTPPTQPPPRMKSGAHWQQSVCVCGREIGSR